MTLCVNPEYEKLLPKMYDEEFAKLKASIQAEGQHYPIVANENLEVLDGHHRFRACVELGIEPDFEVRKFEDKLFEKKIRYRSKPAKTAPKQVSARRISRTTAGN